MVDRDRLEIERLVNLIAGFGWVVSKQEITEDAIVVTIKRVRALVPPEVGAGPF